MPPKCHCKRGWPMIGPVGCTVDGLPKRTKAKKATKTGTKRKATVVIAPSAKRIVRKTNPVLTTVAGTKRSNPYVLIGPSKRRK